MTAGSEILTFVSGLFDAVKDHDVSGIHIPMEDGTSCHVVLFPINGIVQVVIDGQDMGHFEPWDRQDYQYAFYQKRRLGMRDGYTMAEVLLMSICENHPLIRLIKAYN